MTEGLELHWNLQKPGLSVTSFSWCSRHVNTVSVELRFSSEQMCLRECNMTKLSLTFAVGQFPGVLCQRFWILKSILCLCVLIFRRCSFQEVRGRTARQYSCLAWCQQDNHTPCPRSLCVQVKNSCRVTASLTALKPVMWPCLNFP